MAVVLSIPECADADCCVHVCPQNSTLEDGADVSTPFPVKEWCSESFIKMFPNF